MVSAWEFHAERVSQVHSHSLDVVSGYTCRKTAWKVVGVFVADEPQVAPLVPSASREWPAEPSLRIQVKKRSAAAVQDHSGGPCHDTECIDMTYMGPGSYQYVHLLLQKIQLHT